MSSIVSTLASVLQSLTGSKSEPRFKITDERVNTLKRIHAKNHDFHFIVQSYNVGGNYRQVAKVERDIRRWTPEPLARVWEEKDQRAKTPLLPITDKVAVRFDPRAGKRGPFNGIRVVA